MDPPGHRLLASGPSFGRAGPALEARLERRSAAGRKELQLPIHFCRRRQPAELEAEAADRARPGLGPVQQPQRQRLDVGGAGDRRAQGLAARVSPMVGVAHLEGHPPGGQRLSDKFRLELAGQILQASGGRGYPEVLFVLLGLVAIAVAMLATALLRRGSI